MTKNIPRKKPASAEFKFKAALEAIKGEKTTAQICSELCVVSSQLFKWRKELLEKGSSVFGLPSPEEGAQKTIDQLHQTIGKLKVENDFLEKVLGRK